MIVPPVIQTQSIITCTLAPKMEKVASIFIVWQKYRKQI